MPFKVFEKHAAYLRATWQHVALDEEVGARRELGKLGDILTYNRREALELYLDVCSAEIPARTRIELAAKIVSQSGENVDVRLHYTAIKAIGLMQVGEEAKAIEELRCVLASVHLPAQPNDVDEICPMAISESLAAVWDVEPIARIHFAHSLALGCRCGEAEADLRQLAVADVEPGIQLEEPSRHAP